MVGSVIVENEAIIGEGWHQKYGEAHAEINALNSVQKENQARIKDATIFVSLEPCSIQGNTPPCTDAILRRGIQNVVISSRDQTVGVKGVSEYILKNKNLSLSYGVGHTIGDRITAPRNTFVSKRRPYIILKWAQSADGFIADMDAPTAISNQFTQRYVHQLRSEVDAIVVGRRTAIIDDPSLTTRYYTGSHPIRIILGTLDREQFSSLKVLSDGNPTFIFGTERTYTHSEHLTTVNVVDKRLMLDKMCDHLYSMNVMKVLVEGGVTTLQSLLDANLWDECRIITNPQKLKSGIKTPKFPQLSPTQSLHIFDDDIKIYHNTI